MSRAPSTSPIERQMEAADPARSVWVGASAGTGKTTVLTSRVLNLLLRGTPAQRLLCVTYTKAAAAEMANRIAARLADWAVMPQARLIAQLAQLTGRSPDDEVLARARRLFAQVLEAPGGLKIQTIHGFCQSLLGRFPLEAGLPPHFTVIEEAHAAELMHDARETVLARARSGGDPDLARALSIIADHVQEDSFAELVAKLLTERGRLDRAMRRHGGLDGLIAALARSLDVGIDADPVALRRNAVIALDRAAASHACEVLAQGKASDIEKGLGLARVLADTDRDEAWSELLGVLLTKELEPRSRLMTADLAAKHPDVLDFLMEETDRLLGVLERVRKATVLTATRALLTLGIGILAAYARAKKAAAALDYDDLILKTGELLSAEGGASWVLYKLDGGIDHILVDEAQDTNPDQWAVIRALAGEFFTGHGTRTDGDFPRTLFVVGDAKQSIYSFQRADPAAFARMRDFFRDRLEGIDDKLAEIDLDFSFRSTSPVLDAVDRIFERDPASIGVVEPGHTLRHLPYREGHAGLVELWPPAPMAEAVEDTPWSPPVTNERQVEPMTRTAELIAATIRRWLDTGEILESKGRPIRPGDVLVLVRRRGQFVQALVRALKQRGVPVAGVDRMKLTDPIAVMDLIALARFLLLPEDDLTLAVVLKSPLIGLDDDALYTLAHGRSGTLWQALQAASDDLLFAPAHRVLAGLLSIVDFTPPYELFARVLGAERGREALVARLGEEAIDPIDEFLAQALAYEREHPPSLQGFLAWLDAGSTEIKRDADTGERDEVRIMTVHGAKGLEAPIVFLPDTLSYQPQRQALIWPRESLGGDDSIRRDAYIGPLWAPRKGDEDGVCGLHQQARAEADLREYRRLLYVALTRAADRLYITGWPTRRSASSEVWYRLVESGLADQAEEADFDFADRGFEGWAGTGRRIASAQAIPVDPTRIQETAVHASVDLPAWVRRPAPADPLAGKPLTPSRLADLPAVRSPLAASQDEGGYQRGRLIHRLLQTLPDIALDDRAAAGARYLERSAPDLSAETRAALMAETLRVLDDPGFAAVFAPGSRAEVPVIGRIDHPTAGQPGRQIVVGRIDRLAVTDSRVLIVDFKTNRPPPASVDAIAAPYLAQLALYRDLVGRIYPGRRVEAALLWTDIPALMPVPADLLSFPNS